METTDFPMIFLWLWLLIVPMLFALWSMMVAGRDTRHHVSDDRLMRTEERNRVPGTGRA